MIALDIGLALQHFVDPEAVPLDVYPELYELLFGRLRRRVSGRGMATKADFTEAEFETIQRAVSGAGMIVSWQTATSPTASPRPRRWRSTWVAA